MTDKKVEKLELTEYKCDFCNYTFYADYFIVNRCVYCGSTTEFNAVQHLTIIIQSKHKVDNDS